MDRYNFEEHISAYIDGELSPEDKIKFEELMESDSNCREQYNQINSLVKNLSSLPKLETDDDFMDKLNQRIDDYEESKVSIFSLFKKYFRFDNKESTGGFSVSSGGTAAIRPSMGLAMSCAAVLMVFYVSFNASNNSPGMASTPPVDLDNETYYSDVDSTDTDQYEDDIQLTKGVDESK